MIINTLKKSCFVPILFLNLFNRVFVFSWSSLNFCWMYFISFIKCNLFHRLNGGRPCELHWEKPWASSHPQHSLGTMRTEGMSVDRAPDHASTKLLGGFSSHPGHHSQVLC